MDVPLTKMQSLFFTDFGIKKDSLVWFRKNEAASYKNQLGEPHYSSGLGMAVLNESVNGQFSYLITGQPFAMNDIGNAYGAANI